MPMTAQMLDDTACLVVFLKAPARSKRRLASEIGAAATDAAEHLLACALEDAAAWRGPVALAPAADVDADWLVRHASVDHELVIQHGDSLGERINHVDRALRARGYDRLIFIGADCPLLDQAYLAAADAALAHADAVLGPAVDGGVVLMASRRPWPAIGTLSWSTGALRAELTGRLTNDGWSIATLATLTDVDTAGDLAAVASQLAKDARPARRGLSAWLAGRRRTQGSPV